MGIMVYFLLWVMQDFFLSSAAGIGILGATVLAPLILMYEPQTQQPTTPKSHVSNAWHLEYQKR